MEDIDDTDDEVLESINRCSDLETLQDNLLSVQKEVASIQRQILQTRPCEATCERMQWI